MANKIANYEYVLQLNKRELFFVTKKTGWRELLKLNRTQCAKMLPHLEPRAIRLIKNEFGIMRSRTFKVQPFVVEGNRTFFYMNNDRQPFNMQNIFILIKSFRIDKRGHLYLNWKVLEDNFDILKRLKEQDKTMELSV